MKCKDIRRGIGLCLDFTCSLFCFFTQIVHFLLPSPSYPICWNWSLYCTEQREKGKQVILRFMFLYRKISQSKIPGRAGFIFNKEAPIKNASNAFRMSTVLPGSRERRRCISGRLSLHWCSKSPMNPEECSNISSTITFLLFWKTFKSKLEGIITIKKLYWCTLKPPCAKSAAPGEHSSYAAVGSYGNNKHAPDLHKSTPSTKVLLQNNLIRSKLKCYLSPERLWFHKTLKHAQN